MPKKNLMSTLLWTDIKENIGRKEKKKKKRRRRKGWRRKVICIQCTFLQSFLCMKVWYQETLSRKKLCGRSTLFMVATLYAEDQCNDQEADLGYSVKEEPSDEPYGYMRPELFSQWYRAIKKVLIYYYWLRRKLVSLCKLSVWMSCFLTSSNMWLEVTGSVIVIQSDLQRSGLPDEVTAVVSMSGENIINPTKR